MTKQQLADKAGVSLISLYLALSPLNPQKSPSPLHNIVPLHCLPETTVISKNLHRVLEREEQSLMRSVFRLHLQQVLAVKISLALRDLIERITHKLASWGIANFPTWPRTAPASMPPVSTPTCSLNKQIANGACITAGSILE